MKNRSNGGKIDEGVSHMEQTDKELLTRLLPFWGKLNEQQKQQVLGHTVLHSFKAGDHVHGGLDDCTGVIAVKRGSLRVYFLSEEGREITLYRLLENDVCLLSASLKTFPLISTWTPRSRRSCLS